MTREDFRNWTLSEYNESEDDQLDYYINERKCDVGDAAYLYSHADECLTEMKIVHIIRRSDDMALYDEMGGDILFDREAKYGADTSAEFITDNNCYLIWFKYVE